MVGPAIKTRSVLLKDYLTRLDQLANTQLEEYLEGFVLRSAIERYLQLTIEALVDHAAHLLVKLDLPSPMTRADVFVVLCNNGILPNELKQVLVEMVRFRNLLVHGYAQLDSAQVWSILQEKRSVFKKVAFLLLEKIEDL